MRLAPGAATILFAAAAAAALLAHHVVSVVVLTTVLVGVILVLAEPQRRAPYLFGALSAGIGVFLLSPFLATVGSHILWSGPTLPVLGPLDVTTEELQAAALNGFRLAAVALSFAAYALLVDHDRLVASVRVAPRSALAVALATRLVPTLERDAAGLRDAVRGRGVAVDGLRGHARLLSPLVAGSLERASNLAEAMEARGYGRPGRTVAPGRPWQRADRLAVLLATVLVAGGILWL